MNIRKAITDRGFGGLLAGLLVAACGGGHPEAVMGDPAAGDPGSSPLLDTLPDLSDPLEVGDLLSQEVTWGATTVRITGARVDTSDDGTRAELTLSLFNGSRSDADYRGRSTWDLVLASGERVPPAGALGVRLLPGEEEQAVLSYAVTQGTTLQGARLVLEGPNRGELEPLVVPLDAPAKDTTPVELSSLAGKRVGSADEHGNLLLAYEVRGAFVSVNDADAGRAPLAHRFVRLDVKATAGAFAETQYASADDFRLVHDGGTLTPTSDADESLSPSSSAALSVVFTVPATVARFEITVAPGRVVGRLAAEVPGTAGTGPNGAAM